MSMRGIKYVEKLIYILNSEGTEPSGSQHNEETFNAPLNGDD